MLKYYALAIPNALLQIALTHGVYLLLGIGAQQIFLRTLLHFTVMVVLFIFSFILQKRWVFANKKKETRN